MPDWLYIGKILSQFILVSLPSLTLLVWTADAYLIVAADVFWIALIQVIFIAAYIGYLMR